MISIRVLGSEDAPAFREFRLEALEASPFAFAESAEEHRAKSPDFFAERLASRDDEFVLGAFSDDRIVGTAGFYRSRGLKAKHKGHVWGVYVNPAHRGKGAGKALMAELLSRARAIDGVEQVVLTVAVTQKEARRLYESAGFESFGCEPRALRNGDEFVDEEYMILRLC